MLRSTPKPKPNPNPGASVRVPATLSALFAALVLGGCGGDAALPTDAPVAAPAPAPIAPAPTPAPSTLSGSVAVGAPITDGKLRVLDATGATVVADVAIAADGTYPAITLTGTAPWRLEACGYTGANYRCLYSVAQAAGTANVTPLTSAIMLLASGQAPESLMTGSASGLSATAVAAAQVTLRTSLAPVLLDAGVGASLDLVTGSLAAGSRTGYDRVLDAVGVSTGTDTRPFVQIVPRLGSGNLYMEQGSATVGTLAVNSGAATLSLQGLETLFTRMTAAALTATTCANASTGMVSLLSSSASLSMGQGSAFSGAAAVGQGLCMFLAGGGGEPSRLGSRFMSPVLGRCDFSGTAPVCAVSFALQGADGGVEQVGNGMGVSFEAGGWKFKGDLHAVAINASARVQRSRRVDSGSGTVADQYSRALAFDIPALPGLACAKVAQRDATGALVTLALFKPHAGVDLERLSAWRSGMDGASRSLDPAVGNTRGADDTWLELPQGEAGDTAVRNFYRGGREVTVSLYSDSQCSTAFMAAGSSSSFEVEVEGVPPVWAALPGLPWPNLSDSAKAALRSLVVPPSSSADLAVGWGYTQGPVGVGGITYCSDRAVCGSGDAGRLADANLRPSATSTVLRVRTAGSAVEAGSYKMLALYGRTSDGMGLQSNHMSCPTVAAGLSCEN